MEDKPNNISEINDNPMVGEILDYLRQVQGELFRIRLAMRMVSDAMVTDPRDWSVRRTDAWLYSILVGWNSESEEEIIQLHGSAFYGACRLHDQLEKDAMGVDQENRTVRLIRMMPDVMD